MRRRGQLQLWKPPPFWHQELHPPPSNQDTYCSPCLPHSQSTSSDHYSPRFLAVSTFSIVDAAYRLHEDPPVPYWPSKTNNTVQKCYRAVLPKINRPCRLRAVSHVYTWWILTLEINWKLKDLQHFICHWSTQKHFRKECMRSFLSHYLFPWPFCLTSSIVSLSLMKGSLPLFQTGTDRFGAGIQSIWLMLEIKSTTTLLNMKLVLLLSQI